MKTRKGGAVLRQVHSLFNLGATRELSDGQLLERFATARGEAGELAFAALVERHGAMVLGVCRARLADPNDALDAFQATFLVLVRKARGLWVHDSLGPWLHQVAWRTATCAKVNAARRRRLEREAGEASGLGKATGTIEPGWEQVLHQEIDRLPERYRVPIVLCDLQGLSCEEAARRMGRPVGTVKSWRSRGRDRLRARLTRAGFAPAAGLATILSPRTTNAAVPKSAEEAVWNAARAAADGATAGVIPTSVAALAKGVLKEMFMNTLRRTSALVVALALVAAGRGAAAQVAAMGGQASNDQTPGKPSPRVARTQPTRRSSKTVGREVWPLTLREAIKISLDNSEGVRVVDAGRLVIEPTSGNADPWRFKSKVMANLRSVETQYWALTQQHTQLRAAEESVELAEEVLERLSSGSDRGKPAETAEARQRLEQFRLDLVTRTSDVITTERQLRNLLGLPLADDRRIDPVSSPTESQLKPDWNDSLAIMLEEQPDIARVRAGRSLARLMPGIPTSPTTAHYQKLPDFEGPTRTTIPGEPRDELVRQVIHRTTHSLARAFLELDATYKQYRAAQGNRAAAAKKLAVLWEACFITREAPIDRYLDAVSLHAGAVGQEAQFKAAYNVGITAFEEARGTLLGRHKITLKMPPGLAAAATGPQRAPARPAPAPARARDGVPATAPSPTPVEEPVPPVGPAGKTYSFHFTVGTAPRPVEIRGSFTITPAPAPEAGHTP